MSSSPSANPGHGVATAAAASRPTDPKGFASFLRTQDEVDALCDEYGVPKNQYTARPAGDLCANSTPPPRAICVYAQALEAGMRVPLEGFLREALAHFGIAPAQLTPNGWRMMAGFLVLCHLTGVPPSLAVFRRFFLLSNVSQKHKKGWYFFRSRDSSDLRFTGMPHPYSISFKDWKHEFFFLSSPEPWPCAMEWREPSKSSLVMPVLTGEENQWAAKLLRAYGGAAVDLNAYLTTSNLAAAMAITTSKGMYPSAHDRMKTMLAEKADARASASANRVKAEPGGDAAGSLSLCGEKRGLEEANGEEEVPPLSLLNTPLSSVCAPPPGFSRKPQHIAASTRHAGDTMDWDAARELLQGAVSTPLERAFAANEPSDVVKSSFAAILQAANYAPFSFRYALELEEKLAAREREAAALREQLEEAKAELAATKQAKAELEKAKGWLAVAKRAGEAQAELAAARAEAVEKRAELAALKRAAEAEAEKAKAGLAAAEAVAVQQLLASEEDVRRRAEHALEGYERWRGLQAPAGRAA
ncbi:hypothetical protein VPH35_135614 [Triticum aestivum]|uniref:uncharacterized protein n=1 Tax=Triticum aestivum TaxID=4565 RepID=UPI000DF589F9|nr:uncharacterized protein LOC123166048 [Triticum aestivum]